MVRLREVRNGNLVRAPSSFNGFVVHYLRSGPTFWRSQNDHRPCGHAIELPGAGLLLNPSDFFDDGVERRGHELVHGFRLVTFYEVRLIAIAGEQLSQLCVT